MIDMIFRIKEPSNKIEIEKWVQKYKEHGKTK